MNLKILKSLENKKIELSIRDLEGTSNELGAEVKTEKSEEIVSLMEPESVTDIELINRYNNFNAKESIARKAGRRTNTPHLVLNPEKTNFFEMTIDDFTMENYNPIKPQLKLELGI